MTEKDLEKGNLEEEVKETEAVETEEMTAEELAAEESAEETADGKKEKKGFKCKLLKLRLPQVSTN